MAIYTTEIRDICRVLNKETARSEYPDVSETIAGARTKIFDFPYPIFDTDYKPTLETKILMHYYTREIGLETYGLWKLKLMTKLNEIMPYYNQLYLSTLKEFNPFADTDYWRTHEGESKDVGSETYRDDKTGNATDTYSETTTSDRNRDTTAKTEVESKDVVGTTDESNDNGTTNTSDEGNVTTTTNGGSTLKRTTSNENRYSDTPQGALTGIKNNEYLTNATLDDGTLNDTASNNENVQQDTRNTGETTTTAKHTGSSDTTDNYTSTTDSTGNETNKDTGTKSSNNAHNYTDNTTGARDNTLDTTDKYIEHVSGKMGTTSYQELLDKWRDTMINVDMLIINELEPLFMQLWN